MRAPSRGGGFGLLPNLRAPQWVVTADDAPPPEFYRCQIDGCLVTERTFAAHRGHKLQTPVTFGWVEWLLVNLRIIR